MTAADATGTDTGGQGIAVSVGHYIRMFYRQMTSVTSDIYTRRSTIVNVRFANTDISTVIDNNASSRVTDDFYLRQGGRWQIGSGNPSLGRLRCRSKD